MASVRWKAAVAILSMALVWVALRRQCSPARPLITVSVDGGNEQNEQNEPMKIFDTEDSRTEPKTETEAEEYESSTEPQLLSDMVFEYPNVTRRAVIDTMGPDGMTEEVFNVYDGSCRGGKVILEEVKESLALSTCAADQLCQAVYCTSHLSCTLLSPTCRLRQGPKAQGVVYVIIGRTPQKTHLWDILTERMTNGISKKELQKRKREFPASELTVFKKMPKSALNDKIASWQTPVTRTRKGTPYIEMTEADKMGMGGLTSVDPVHKVVIFRVLKVLSTNLFRLYDRLIGHTDVILDTEGRINPWGHNDQLRERIQFKMLPLKTANEIMNDPSWKKIVFFRDPAERLLSCWKDKFLEGPMGYLFRKYRRGSSKVPFSDFVDYVDREEDAPFGHGPQVNGHYRPQMLLSNIFRFLPLFDFIGWGNNNHSRQMLEKYGLWEEYGAKTWPYGFMRSNDNHTTGAKKSFSDYYSPELLKRAKKAYDIDYKFFEMMGLEKDGPPITGEKLVPFHANCFEMYCWPGEPDSRWM
eukprot:TRINITY_DN408_c4_g1_i1.p1 TRINITY_DN408_c4_g1~~TRINITY_DN408_c4_g1_i1.p1  ORF type:complete len:527 (+),score=72.28 TRINITY_DN408_c4_g1_i1:50-1630(+)